MTHREIFHVRTVLDLVDQLFVIAEKSFVTFEDEGCLNSGREHVSP